MSVTLAVTLVLAALVVVQSAGRVRERHRWLALFAPSLDPTRYGLGWRPLADWCVPASALRWGRLTAPWNHGMDITAFLAHDSFRDWGQTTGSTPLPVARIRGR